MESCDQHCMHITRSDITGVRTYNNSKKLLKSMPITEWMKIKRVKWKMEREEEHKGNEKYTLVRKALHRGG